MITTLSGTLAADVANGGTLVVSYPSGLMLGNFTGSVGHKLNVNQVNLSAPYQFSVAFGASITITNQTASTWKAGSSYILQVNTLGDTPSVDISGFSPKNAVATRPTLVSLGNPVVGAATAILTSQALTAAAGALTVLTGSTAGILDVPRNIVAAWTGTAVMTFRGFDVYGNALTESSASGTSFAGKKAFAKVISIQVGADVTGLTVGTGNVLGLPVYLATLGFIIKELQDGTLATAGTSLAGVQTAGGSTATTGDIRGTYVPNATPDGTKSFQLLLATPDLSYRGMPQFAG